MRKCKKSENRIKGERLERDQLIVEMVLAGGVDLGALLETLHLVRREVGLARNREGRLERALDQIREEKTALEKENGKLKYQVLHLKRSVQEADSRG